MKKKILVFGLTGDPPHLGHEAMAIQMVQQGYADEVWFVPCGQHPFDKNEGTMSSRADRLAMTRIVVDRLNLQHGAHFVCSPLEIKKKTKSYTIETLETVAKEHPDADISFLMGSDQLSNFDKWERWEEILDRFRVYVYPRLNYPMEPWYPSMIRVEDATMLEQASSMVREREGRRAQQADVAEDVQSYIETRSLYAKANH